ncbi:uncharacterized protein B0J16DRAFT_386817 [Fusarium flagelliforme]|nr:uncharacterized protein B0J16DRAFT_386817 [Fusarium flagelliforme]KAH7178991.1 hypothetical protein B0J16DRAFT_386817 [Fusarium flagelliforme]
MILNGATLPSGVPKKLWDKFQDTFFGKLSTPASQKAVPDLAADLDTGYDTDASYKPQLTPLNPADHSGSSGKSTDPEVICISDTSIPSTPASSTCSAPRMSPSVQRKKTLQSKVDRLEPSYSLRRKRSLDQAQDGDNVQHKRPRRMTKADELRSSTMSDLSKSTVEKEQKTTPPVTRMTLRPRPASRDSAKSMSKKRKRGSDRESSVSSLSVDELEVPEPSEKAVSLVSRGDIDDKVQDSIQVKIPSGAQRTLHAFAKLGFVRRESSDASAA